MEKVLVLVLAMLTAWASGFLPDQQNPKTDVHRLLRTRQYGPLTKNSRIVGGNYAWNTFLPYQASVNLVNNDRVVETCGGTLIGNEWILTSARRCLYGTTLQNDERVEIGLGSVYKDRPMVATFATEIYYREPYNFYEEGDIALVRIPRVEFNERIAPADLPARNGEFSSYFNASVTASGWGIANEAQCDMEGVTSNYLKYAVTKVIETSECTKTFGANDFNGTNTICVSTSGGQSIAYGDYGGPLVLEGTRTLIGISALVMYAGCDPDFPTAFTRVTSYLNWINEITGI